MVFERGVEIVPVSLYYDTEVFMKDCRKSYRYYGRQK